MSNGRVFQCAGAATEKDLAPYDLKHKEDSLMMNVAAEMEDKV